MDEFNCSWRIKKWSFNEWALLCLKDWTSEHWEPGFPLTVWVKTSLFGKEKVCLMYLGHFATKVCPLSFDNASLNELSGEWERLGGDRVTDWSQDPEVEPIPRWKQISLSPPVHLSLKAPLRPIPWCSLEFDEKECLGSKRKLQMYVAEQNWRRSPNLYSLFLNAPQWRLFLSCKMSPWEWTLLYLFFSFFLCVAK
jgi:hypothetical protein